MANFPSDAAYSQLSPLDRAATPPIAEKEETVKEAHTEAEAKTSKVTSRIIGKLSIPEPEISTPASKPRSRRGSITVMNQPTAATSPNATSPNSSLNSGRRTSSALHTFMQATAASLSHKAADTSLKATDFPSVDFPDSISESDESDIGDKSEIGHTAPLERQLKDTIQAKLPDNAEQDIKEWLKNNPQDQLKAKNPDRFNYEEKDILPALALFQKPKAEGGCGCEWRKMKEIGMDPKYMQVINDSRACSTEKYVMIPLKEQCNKEYGHLLQPFSEELSKKYLSEGNSLLETQNAGSAIVTSDLDWGLGFRKVVSDMNEELSVAENNLSTMKSQGGNQEAIQAQTDKVLKMEKSLETLVGKLEALETKYSDTANQLSSAQTGGALWSGIYDSNFYTQQEKIQLTDPEIQKMGSGIKEQSSLLHKLRTSPEQFEQFEQQLLEKASGNPQQLAHIKQQFEEVKQTSRDLDLTKNIKIISLSTEHANIEEQLAFESDLLEADPEEIKARADKLLEDDPQIGDKAANALHSLYKQSAARNEQVRAETFFNLKTLDRLAESNNPVAFTAEFKKSIDVCVNGLLQQRNEEPNQEVRDEIESMIVNLQAQVPDANNQQAFMETFVSRRGIEKQEVGLDAARSYAEGAKNELASLNATMEKAKKIPISADALKTLEKKIADKEKEIIATMQKKLTNAPVLKRKLTFESTSKGFDLATHINGLITDLDQRITKVKTEKRELARENGENWSAAGSLEKERERAACHMMIANMNGMPFAPESHFNVDVTSVIVGGQMGLIAEHTVAGLVNTVSEVSAFLVAHQEHHEGEGWAKLVESSKYADRLVLQTEKIMERCEALGLPKPDIGNESGFTLGKLKTFETGMLKLRKNIDLPDKDKAVAANNLIKELLGTTKLESDTVGHTLENLNERFLEINVSLYSWLTSLPLEQQTARYKAA